MKNKTLEIIDIIISFAYIFFMCLLVIINYKNGKKIEKLNEDNYIIFEHINGLEYWSIELMNEIKDLKTGKYKR